MLKSDMMTIYGNMGYDVGETYRLEGELIPCVQGSNKN